MESVTTRGDSTLRHLGTSALYTAITVLAFGLAYPLAMTLAATLLFPTAANGSLVVVDGKAVGSSIIGEAWTKPRYFHGRPSATGKNGYDPTATGATNLGPTSKKLIDAARSTIAALARENPHAAVPVPMDLVTSSGSGIDPDISPEAASYQAPRVAAARKMSLVAVDALIAKYVRGRDLGLFGEPRVDVLRLNLALDRAGNTK